MRKWCGLFLSGALAIALAAPSSAEPKNFNATFSLELGSFPPFVETATGSLDATIAGGVVTAFTVPTNIFDLNILTPVDPKITIDDGIFLTGVSVVAVNTAGAFNHAGGGAGDGLMSVKGQSVLKITISGGGKLSGKIPLTGAIGQTKQVKASLLGIPVTLDAKKWTLGKATLVSIPIGKTTEVPVTAKGTFAAVGKNNTFTYVAPTQITINQEQDSKIPSFGFLTVEILDVPEAGNVLLLATGAAVLIALGLRRRSVA
jgi:hypothetical protein